MTVDNSHEFRDLHRRLDRIDGYIDTVSGQVTEVTTHVNRVSTDLASNTAELRQLKADFLEFVGQAQRTANIQRSETVLGNIEAALERDFGHYKVVRRSSIGTLQAFDLGNVSNATVQTISEQLMIQTPRYWLAPALVALAAWSRDDQELCEKSVDAAFSREAKKTSLFFALVLRRQSRLESAARWLKHYLVSIDPRSTTREFAVILEATAGGAFGEHGKALIGSHVGKWNDQLRNDPAVGRAQVEAWTNELSIQRATVDDSKYPYLSKVSPQWPSIKSSLEHASALGIVDARFRPIRDTPDFATGSIVDKLDDILEILVTEYDPEELPYQRDVAYHRAVIDNNGDLDRAQEAADAYNVALEETMDLMTLQTQTALRPKALGVSQSTQKVAVGAARADFEAAVGIYTTRYRSEYLPAVDIALDGNHSNYAQTLGFGQWRTSTATPQEESERELAQAWQQAVAAYLERVRFKEINYAIAGGIALVATIIGFLIGPIAGLLLMLAAGGGAGFWVWRKKTEADRLYNEAVVAQQQALQFSVDIYRGAMAEFVDTRFLYEEEDARERDLLELIRSWPTVVTMQAERAVS